MTKAEQASIVAWHHQQERHLPRCLFSQEADPQPHISKDATEKLAARTAAGSHLGMDGYELFGHLSEHLFSAIVDYFANFSSSVGSVSEEIHFRQAVYFPYTFGYPGSKVYLTGMYPKITSANISLSKHYNIELWAIYEIETLGKWDIGVPENVKIKHIQWHPDVYATTMKDIDIGLVPACMPIKKEFLNYVK